MTRMIKRMMKKYETCPDDVTPDDMEVEAGDNKNVNNYYHY